MSEIVLLDGSIGQELVHRAGDKPTPLWSTTVMMEHAELLSQLHRDYFAAGATVATTNTYAVHRDRLERAGIGDSFEKLVDLAVDAAVSARDSHGSGRVAGSLGPLGASYRPDIRMPPEDAASLFAELVARMDDRVDLLLIETAASVEHAEGALLATKGASSPTWLAVTVDDDDGSRLRSGEPVGDLAGLVEGYGPDAVLVNCSRPEAVPAALDIIAGFGVAFGAYANGFTRISEAFLQDAPTVDVLESRTDLDPAAYAEFALGWVAQGATIVGGCCEVGPAHIGELARQLAVQGHVIV